MAVVHVHTTSRTRDPCSTRAVEIVERTRARPSVQTRRGLALVRLPLAVGTRVTRQALAGVGVNPVYAAQGGVSLTGVAEAVVNIGLAQGAGEARGARAGEGTLDIL